ncbi:MAG: aminotransferase class III-fold pyridoxal phosphate-dependent enzyme [Treponema sp.]|nr:aminotransferase class III-fold pyridoxal phosphate-dependent enzyme [Treponema sp.]
MANEFPHLRLERSMAMFEEAKRLSPGGVMGIRRPYNFVQGEYPIFIDKGYGGHIVDVDGNDYIDMLCAYGPVILGYDEKEINEAVKRQMDEKGFCFSLVQPVQNEFERKVVDLVPCAEMVIPVKTGSDATTLAVRIARGYTDREVILRCGYHGWHDWCVEGHGGVPESTLGLTDEFEYGDLGALEEKLRAHDGKVACVIITPVGHPLAKPVQAPTKAYLEGVKKLAHDHGAVLIFDEIRTGFRAALGGAQERYGVTPDLGTFGKAMANGYPLSCVAGKAEIMSVCEKKVFVSSTFFPNSLEMVAALKTMEILVREDVPDSIWKRGTKFLSDLESIVAKSGVPATVSGIPPMPFITFDAGPGEAAGTPGEKIYKARREYFYTQTIRRGLFIQPFHHWYIAHRHTDADLKKALDVIAESLELTMKKYPAP